MQLSGTCKWQQVALRGTVLPCAAVEVVEALAPISSTRVVLPSRLEGLALLLLLVIVLEQLSLFYRPVLTLIEDRGFADEEIKRPRR